MIKSNSIFNLIFRLRGGLSRDQYGMQHEGLYTRARGGTKTIIEKYNDTVVKALDMICDSNGEEDQVACVCGAGAAAGTLCSMYRKMNGFTMMLLCRFRLMQSCLFSMKLDMPMVELPCCYQEGQLSVTITSV